MKIVTDHIYPPIPCRDFDWCAIDSDSYDGTEDDPHRGQIGYGATEAEAISSLREILEDACSGHLASAADPKVCDRCGIHIDSLRPPEGET